MPSIVIVPQARLGGVYEDNRIWARQYVAADPDARGIVELTRSSPEATLRATERAIREATTSGRVIYAVGHGGTSSQPFGGQADLAPNRAFRITQFLAYDGDSTGTWQGRPVSEMERDRAEALSAPPRARSARRTAWCERYLESNCATAWAQVGELAALRPHYAALCQMLHDTPVSRVVMLTCNVANAPDFLNELSTDFGVRVVAYTERVMSRWESSGRSRQVWMYLEGDAPGTGTNTDQAMTQLLPGAGSRQVVGSVRPAQQRRHAAVPELHDE